MGTTEQHKLSIMVQHWNVTVVFLQKRTQTQDKNRGRRVKEQKESFNAGNQSPKSKQRKDNKKNQRNQKSYTKTDNKT